MQIEKCIDLFVPQVHGKRKRTRIHLPEVKFDPANDFNFYPLQMQIVAYLKQ